MRPSSPTHGLFPASLSIVVAIMSSGCFGPSCVSDGLRLYPDSDSHGLIFPVEGLTDPEHAAAFNNATFSLVVSIATSSRSGRLLPQAVNGSGGLMGYSLPEVQEADLARGVDYPFSFAVYTNSTDPWVLGLAFFGTNNTAAGTVMMRADGGSWIVRSSDFQVNITQSNFTVGGNLGYRLMEFSNCATP